MKKLIFFLLFIPLGLFAQQKGDNTILIHTPYSAKENFTLFKKHLDISEFFYFENAELNRFKTDNRVIHTGDQRIVNWMFYVYCNDSLIIVVPHIAFPSWVQWEYKERIPAYTIPEVIAYNVFIRYLEGFEHPLTFKKL